MRVVRAEVRDAYAHDGETVLMIDNNVILLSPIASLIWESCESPVTVDALVDVLATAFGAPPTGDALAHVKEALTSLESVGAVSRL